MEKGISRFTVHSSSMVVYLLILFGSPTIAIAESSVEGCAQKYYQAAKALDEKRADCGLSSDGQSAFCQTAARINIPVEIEGFSFNINVGAAFRFLSALHLVPNQFRQAAKFIQQAQAGSGGKLRRQSRKIARHIAGTTQEEVAQIISQASEDGRLCEGNHLLSVREIREFVESEIVN